MENRERIHKTVGSRSTKLKHHALGKENTLKQLPLRQLQIHATVPNALVGKTKTHKGAKQFSKAFSKVDTPCQADDPQQKVGPSLAGATDDWKMCTEEKPPEKYWEILAERRRVALADALEENKKLHEEIKRLKEKVKELEDKNSDADYFAMMYSITKPTLATDT